MKFETHYFIRSNNAQTFTVGVNSVANGDTILSCDIVTFDNESEAIAEYRNLVLA
jgi:hypothetical protein